MIVESYGLRSLLDIYNILNKVMICLCSWLCFLCLSQSLFVFFVREFILLPCYVLSLEHLGARKKSPMIM